MLITPDDDMKTTRSTKRTLLARAGVFSAAILSVLLVSACMQNYGRLMSSAGVRLSFKQFEVKDGYTYYYYGFAGEPDALLGLRDDYTLESDLWKRIDFSQTSMQTMVDRLGRNTGTGGNGAVLKDPAGNDVGVWFAVTGTATIKFSGEKRIAFISPQISRKSRNGAQR
jgi:hypothetical protein